MSRGNVELRTPAAVRVVTGDFGLGTRLCFVDDKTGEVTSTLLGSAFRCAACETVIIAGKARPDDFDCFECGARISAGADACPVCGWTW